MKKLLLVSLLISFCLSAYSQNREFPYELNLKKELIYSGIGIGLYGLSKLPESNIDKSDIDKLNRNDVWGLERNIIDNWDDDKNKLRESFEPAICAAAVVTAGVSAVKFKNNSTLISRLTTLGVMYAEGIAVTWGMKDLTKSLIPRYRPYAYNDNITYKDKPKDEIRGSFYSGNAALMFYNTAFITKVCSDLFPDSKMKYIVGGAGLSWSVYSAYLSVKSGRHFPTDVLAGAVIGSFTGYMIPQLHLKDRNNKKYSFNFSSVLIDRTPCLSVKIAMH